MWLHAGAHDELTPAGQRQIEVYLGRELDASELTTRLAKSNTIVAVAYLGEVVKDLSTEDRETFVEQLLRRHL